MVFGFLKRNKKEKNDKISGTDGFWENCITTRKLATISPDSKLGPIEDSKEFQIPFEDIRRYYDDESYLKNIINNHENDLHRRTAALFYLFNFHNEMDLNAGQFFSLIRGSIITSDTDDEPLDVNVEEFCTFADIDDELDVRSDFFDLVNVQEGTTLKT